MQTLEEMTEAVTCSAFSGTSRVAGGLLPEVVRAAKMRMENEDLPQILIFDDRRGAQIDVDLNGPLELILKHLPGSAQESAAGTANSPTRPGRPKLGVVAREVTLLPRHWEWLSAQPGGASITLRKLVEDARRSGSEQETARRGREACYRFMVAAAGNQPRFEEAARALFAADDEGFSRAIANWPEDLAAYAEALRRGSQDTIR